MAIQTRMMTLTLDDDDFDTIQKEITERQVRDRKNFGRVMLPDGDSDLAGAILAECIRDLNEYRRLYKAEHDEHD